MELPLVCPAFEYQDLVNTAFQVLIWILLGTHSDTEHSFIPKNLAQLQFFVWLPGFSEPIDAFV